MFAVLIGSLGACSDPSDDAIVHGTDIVPVGGSYTVSVGAYRVASGVGGLCDELVGLPGLEDLALVDTDIYQTDGQRWAVAFHLPTDTRETECIQQAATFECELVRESLLGAIHEERLMLEWDSPTSFTGDLHTQFSCDSTEVEPFGIDCDDDVLLDKSAPCEGSAAVSGVQATD